MPLACYARDTSFAMDASLVDGRSGLRLSHAPLRTKALLHKRHFHTHDLVFLNGNTSELEGILASMRAACTHHVNADKVTALLLVYCTNE